MTGRIPPRHGVRDNGTYRLDPAQPTLPAAIKSAGYQTGAFIGAFVLDARFGLARGFDVYDDRYGQRPSAGRMDVVERPADQVTTSAAAWIRAATAPWFAWVHLYDPHEPYAPPEPFASRYRSTPYDGEVAYSDAALGRMLDDLQSAGRLDRTLVVVAADHGEGLGDHGERTHGLFAYDSTMHVPLIVWCGGGCWQPRTIADPAGLVDVAPTILDLLGIAWSAADGRSLRARLTGGEPADAAATPTYFEALNANLTRNWAPLTGVVAGALKLIDLPVPELYDLRADPGRNAKPLRGAARGCTAAEADARRGFAEAEQRRRAARSTARRRPGCVRSATSRRSPRRRRRQFTADGRSEEPRGARHGAGRGDEALGTRRSHGSRRDVARCHRRRPDCRWRTTGSRSFCARTDVLPKPSRCWSRRRRRDSRMRPRW